MAQRGRAEATSFDPGYILGHGILSGWMAGVVFILFEMVATAIRDNNAIAPLQAMSAIVLGTGTMSGAFDVTTVVVVGLIVHFVVAALWGIVFALILSLFPGLSVSFGLALLAGMIFGALVWLIDFYIIAPLAFPWFTFANPQLQFLAHAFFYGLPLGAYFGAVSSATRSAF